MPQEGVYTKSRELGNFHRPLFNTFVWIFARNNIREGNTSSTKLFFSRDARSSNRWARLVWWANSGTQQSRVSDQRELSLIFFIFFFFLYFFFSRLEFYNALFHVSLARELFPQELCSPPKSEYILPVDVTRSELSRRCLSTRCSSTVLIYFLNWPSVVGRWQAFGYHVEKPARLHPVNPVYRLEINRSRQEHLLSLILDAV